ncbi:MAG: hypothetical protein GC171_14980 [Terrimonas sp.]|nr:hypothetical protein [Terrimonas sp.]
MKKLFILSLFSLAFLVESHAQAAKSVYFELGGPGLASFNFDTRFGPREEGLGGRIGVGGFSISSGSDKYGVVFIPIGLNYLLGNDGKNYFELGGGITPVFSSSNTSSSSDNFSSTFGNILFGYRMQPEKGGFTFRAFINPIFGSFGFIPYYGGVSFGYKF